jgi:hypothetical protein
MSKIRFDCSGLFIGSIFPGSGEPTTGAIGFMCHSMVLALMDRTFSPISFAPWACDQ